MIGFFRPFYCQKVLPLVYDESLSYYEFLCKLMRKLNEVIENVNKLLAGGGKSSNGGWYDVTMFGADKTGAKNSSVAFNTLIKQIGSEGGYIFVPKGTYLLDDGVVVDKDGVYIVGAGIDSTYFKRGDNATGPMFDYANIEGGGLSNCTIDGNGLVNRTNANHVQTYKSDGQKFENVHIDRARGIGFAASHSYHVDYEDCSVDTTYGKTPAFWCGYDEGTQELHGYHIYEHCKAERAALDGIIVNDNYVTIRDCQFNYNGTEPGENELGGSGIFTGYFNNSYTGLGLFIENCICYRNTEDGINLETADNCKVIGNTLSFNGLCGLMLGAVTRGTGVRRIYVANNDCVSNAQSNTTLNPEEWNKNQLAIKNGNSCVVVGNVLIDSQAVPTADYNVHFGGTNERLIVTNNNMHNYKTGAYSGDVGNHSILDSNTTA